MTELNNDLKELLRAGLSSRIQRERALVELHENYPFNRQRTIVEVALKDTSVTYDDLEEILSGEHYAKHIAENIKFKEEARKLLESSAEEEEDFFGKADMNNIITPPDQLGKEDTSNKIPIVDSTGFEEKCFLNVDMDDVLFYKQTGDFYEGESQETYVGQKIVIDAVDKLKKMSKVDQADFFRSINNAYDASVQNKKKLVSKAHFVEELNKQLSKEELVRFVNLVLKLSKDVWSTK